MGFTPVSPVTSPSPHAPSDDCLPALVHRDALYTDLLRLGTVSLEASICAKSARPKRAITREWLSRTVYVTPPAILLAATVIATWVAVICPESM